MGHWHPGVGSPAQMRAGRGHEDSFGARRVVPGSEGLAWARPATTFSSRCLSGVPGRASSASARARGGANFSSGPGGGARSPPPPVPTSLSPPPCPLPHLHLPVLFPTSPPPVLISPSPTAPLACILSSNPHHPALLPQFPMTTSISPHRCRPQSLRPASRLKPLDPISCRSCLPHSTSSRPAPRFAVP